MRVDGRPERRLTDLVLHIEVGAVIDEAARHVEMPVRERDDQRRVPFRIHDVQVRTGRR